MCQCLKIWLWVGGSLLGHRSRHSFFSPESSTSASSVRSLNSNLHNNLRYRGVESDLRVSLVNNGLVGPYSATVTLLSSTSASSVRSLNSNLHNNLRYRGVESDLRVSLVNNGLVGPYSATVLVTLSSAPDHRSASSVRSLNSNLHNNLRYRGVESDLRVSREQRVGTGVLRVTYASGSLLGHRSRHSFFSPGSSTSASSVRSLNSNLHNNLRYRGVESDLRVSLVNNGLVGPYSATVLVTLSSAPDHPPPRLAPGSSTSASSVRSLNSNLHNNLRYRGVESDLRVSREQRVGGSLLGHRSRHSFFSPGSSTSASSVRSLNSNFTTISEFTTELESCCDIILTHLCDLTLFKSTVLSGCESDLQLNEKSPPENRQSQPIASDSARIGRDRVESKGYFQNFITIQNTELPAKIHVVNDETILLDAIIGINFLQQTQFTFGRDGIRIFQDVDECKNDDVLVNHANLFDEQQRKLDLPHISNSKIRNDVEQLFIPNYARIARPLSDLRDNVKFKFGPTEIASFQELKNILSENPVLQVFQQGYPLELHTDASSLGFGAVLLQKSDDGLFHPIHYFVAKLQFNRRNIAAMN
ncbi:retrovirus-related Pol polyprotein from transposon 17.6 [Trichonephila clavipes]|uniref:Retrovirus-related Pol polyprotein from transposon 17.6 n=1 Tax=Trichonephila clavipes TaxID=2585209 RepID=A0A8X6S296_TRICX|nr:retrovirus-related Pol polyprotein from transposon 17.6 [Trichonephila clavipes]